MVYYTLKLSSKLQWLILLYFYNKKTKQKSENIPLKLKKKKSLLGRVAFQFLCSTILHNVGCEKGFSAGL